MKTLATLFVAVSLAAMASGQDVLPMIGGAQVGAADAPMQHALVDFDGANLSVHVEASASTPLLRELTSGQFAANEPWAVLTGKAHNFQYGWLPETAWAPPSGLGVFVEQLAISDGLEVYEGGRFMSEDTIRAMTFDPLFQNGDAWQWDGVMTHNAYAVQDPTEAFYDATYRVFLADAATRVEPVDGAGAPLYGSDTVTFTWTTLPEPMSAGLLAIALLAAPRRR